MKFGSLTKRQHEVMLLVCEGLPTKLVADRLGISEGCAKFHIIAAMRKLKADTRTLAAVRFTLMHDATIRERVAC